MTGIYSYIKGGGGGATTSASGSAADGRGDAGDAGHANIKDSQTSIDSPAMGRRNRMSKARSMMTLSSSHGRQQQEQDAKPYRHQSPSSQNSRYESTERTADTVSQPLDEQSLGGGNRNVLGGGDEGDDRSTYSTRHKLRPSLDRRYRSETKLGRPLQNHRKEGRRLASRSPRNSIVSNGSNNRNSNGTGSFHGGPHLSPGGGLSVGSGKMNPDDRQLASQVHAMELSQRFGHQSLSAFSHDDGGPFQMSSGSLNPSATLHLRPKLEQALKLQTKQVREYQRNHRSLSSLDEDAVKYHRSLPSLDEGVAGGTRRSRNRRRSVQVDRTTHVIVRRDRIDVDINDNNVDSAPFELEIEPDEEEQKRLDEEKLSSSFHPPSSPPSPPSAPPLSGGGGGDRHRNMTRSSPSLRSTGTSLDAPNQPHYRMDTIASLADVSPSDAARASACHVVYQQYKEDYARSNIPDLTHKFPQFELSEVMQGRFLGKGSFAQVIEVKGFCLKDDGLFTSWAMRRSTHQRRHDMADGIPLDSSHNNNDDENGGGGGNNSPTEYSFMEEHCNEGGSHSKGEYDDSGNTGEIDDEVTPLERNTHLGYHDITDDDDDDLLSDDNDGSLLISPRDYGDSDAAKHDIASLVGSGDEDDDDFVSNKTPPALASQLNSKKQSSRRFIADHCYRSNSANAFGAANKNDNANRPVARYALKQLRPNILEDPLCLLQGLSDMATETRILSSMTDHPNIIKLRGIAYHQGEGGNPFTSQYFILLDRLYDTLESRIVKWKRQEQKWHGPIRGWLLDRHQRKRRQLWLDRVTFAHDLGSAMAHLHSRYVVHRDLKPDNIGFDLRGDIKVFDLGLAKELPTIHNGHDTLFRFTGMCGSPRYMAPEVAMEEPYNELCDVYSFAIVFWEMMALTVPFGEIDMLGLIEEVWRGNGDEDDPLAKQPRRPSPSLMEKGNFWAGRGIKGMLRRRKERRRLKKQNNKEHDIGVGTPASLQALLEACWSFDLEKRPSMSHVVHKLQEEIIAIRARCDRDRNDDRRFSHKRRRSTFVFESEALQNGALITDEEDGDGAASGNSGTEKNRQPLDLSTSKSTPTDPSSTVRTDDRNFQ